MVAQQILVLFVQVRILVEQQKENKLIGLFSFFISSLPCSFISLRNVTLGVTPVENVTVGVTLRKKRNTEAF